MSNQLPDLSALKASDGEAWAEAFRQLWPMALRAAQHPEAHLVPWETEDIASEAILELISQVESLESVEETKALVITIAYRRAISLARRKSAAKRRVPENCEPASAVSFGDNADLTELERREMIVLLRRAFEVLDVETRLLLEEKIMRDLTYQEISTRYRIPLGTVCTKVARGLKKVRAFLQQSPRLLKELEEYRRY